MNEVIKKESITDNNVFYKVSLLFHGLKFEIDIPKDFIEKNHLSMADIKAISEICSIRMAKDFIFAIQDDCEQTIQVEKAVDTMLVN